MSARRGTLCRPGDEHSGARRGTLCPPEEVHCGARAKNILAANGGHFLSNFGCILVTGWAGPSASVVLDVKINVKIAKLCEFLP